MYYQNSNNYIKRTGKKFLLSTFEGVDFESNETMLPIRFAKQIRGFRCTNGVLMDDLGVKELIMDNGKPYDNLPYKIDNIYVFYLNGERTFLASCDRRAFMFNDTEKVWETVPNTYFNGQDSVNFTVDTYPSIIIPGDGGGLYSYNGLMLVKMKVDLNPTCMATHMNRLFAIDERDLYTLKFSAVNNPNNFNISYYEGGEIYLDVEDGRVVKMLSFNDSLYIFRDYAIYRLKAYSNQRDFELKRVVSCSKIVKDTITVVDNGVMFVSDDGLNYFDGYNIKKLNTGFDSIIPKMNGKLCAGYMGGYYYLAFADRGPINNSVIKYNINDNTFIYRIDMRINKFFSLRDFNGNDNLAVLCDEIKKIGIIINEGTYFGSKITNYWYHNKINFGLLGKEKQILRIYVDKSDRYSLMIYNEKNMTKRISIDGSKSCYEINLRGCEFKVELTCYNNVTQHSPIIEVDMRG